MQSPAVQQQQAADPWRQAPSPATSSRLPPTPPLSSVVSPGSSYGFGSHMESPSMSSVNGTDEDAEAAKRRTNPLIDLIESEKRYVDELGMVIRKVAGAWSRQNFPPPLLDLMFRSIEGVYKINRGFGSKLKEIGPNPSSPKALGDLLMRWIDDMEPAYKRYGTTYLSAFDSWEPVQSNATLHTILADVSAQLGAPPPGPSAVDGKWSLDAFFILPYQRLRYYKKLYARLLKSTQPGRSDHNLLIGANDRLDALLELVRGRLETTVHDEGNPSAFRTSAQGERTSTVSSAANSRSSDQSVFSQNGRDSSNSTSTSYNSLSPPAMQQISEKEPMKRDSDPVPPPPVPRESLADVEKRLAPERTMDLFTMKPRMVRLQINPPSLPFARHLRCSVTVEIAFTPTSTGRPVVHRKAHIFLLSDLFLMCEYMDEKDRLQKAAESADGQRPDLWLSYPPLAGKHLQATPGPTSNTIEVLVMKKERFFITLSSPELQASILRDFNACIEFATNMQATLSARSAAGLPGPTSPEPSLSHGSQSSHALSPVATSPLQAFPPTPLQKQHPNQQRVVSSAPSQASTYSNHSSGGSPSIIQQMDSMSLQSHQSSSAGPSAFSPVNGNPSFFGSRPLSPPQYGQAPAGPAPIDSSRSMPPPRGASLGQVNAPRPPPPGPGPGPGPGQANFNQFPPVRKTSAGPQPPPGPYPHQPLHPGQQQMRPPQHAPFPQYAARPPPPAGPNMLPAEGYNAISRSQSAASQRSQGSNYSEPPLPPPPMMQNGPPDRLSPQSHMHPPNNLLSARPNSDGGGHASPIMGGPPLRQSPSASPIGRQQGGGLSPLNFPSENGMGSVRSRSAEPLTPSLMPSAAFAEVRQRTLSTFDPSSGTSTPPEEVTDLSPPPSPTAEEDPSTLSGPAIISAQMKCKVFLKRNHAQWKSIGSARLKLYHQQSTNVKQVVVESDSSSKTMLISTIVLTDGVERVGKTGVAIEISDQGRRTGVIYMIQLRNEQSAGGLFDSLLAGTNRGK